MAIAAELMDKLIQLDLTSMEAATHYIDFLLYEQKKREQTPDLNTNQASEQRMVEPFDFDCLKGQLKYISEDFDDELDVFEEYK